MRIEVKDRGFKGNEGLRNYVGLRLMSVLDHLVREVEVVSVSLVDVGGSRASVERRCRMLARLIPSGSVAVEYTGPALYKAVDEAAHRLAGGVAKEVARRRPRVPPRRSLGRAPGSQRRPALLAAPARGDR
jgi:hypothetical protein